MIKRAVMAITLTAAGLYVMAIQKGKGETADIRALILKKSKQWKVNPAIIRAIIKVESNFNPRAKNPLDPSYGLMQITPGLAADYGLISDPFSPTRQEINLLYDESNNMNIGCWFLAGLLNKYDFDTAIQMYNVGETGYKKGVRNSTYLERVKRHYGKYI